MRRLVGLTKNETGPCVESGGRAAPHSGDGFESGIDTERPKESAGVIPDRLGLRWSSAAICFVERPCSRRRSTSTWRGVRCGGGAVRMSSGRSSISPNTPTTRSPFMSGTALSSTATRVPEVETKTPVASVAGELPSTFREKSSRARRLSSGATTEVKWRPRTSPTSCLAAALSQRTTPVSSRT